ncbi:sensor histidine kinase [Cohnella nanjingensis]|uniref:histidine kinase n=1 Tax=Cohnella nanjingensis TaxID=1387779 RepID=A0A7X0VIP4_9BACL|nr:HAMP domain-containing sensor histidine kinase [Cohnella nanjingensis]MBB6675430.1 HAMP domain-containing histidine kinase [Cohnella nanjingensis]
MTPNYAGRMLWRLIWQMVLSVVLGMITMAFAIFVVTYLTNYSTTFRRMLYLIVDLFGQTGLYYTGSFFFAIVFMCLLSWPRFRYLHTILNAVGHISQGNFDARVPIRGDNELRVLATHTNRFVERLNHSMAEERKAEQTKNELITNVSHDLRTPLTSILGYLGLAEQDRYRDEIELRHYISIAYQKSQRMHVLINDLFEYTRTRHAAQTLKLSAINLTEMMKQLLEHQRVMLTEAGMEGHLRAPDAEVTVMGDPAKLVRVFENLLINAVAYGKDGGKVDIAVYRYPNEAVVEVTNYGEPIPSTDLPYIFDRFYRVDKSRTEHSGGSGLGLAISKSLVEMHGGTIAAESDALRTAFRVALPLKPKNNPA